MEREREIEVVTCVDMDDGQRKRCGTWKNYE